jgi:hypothetical protein
VHVGGSQDILDQEKECANDVLILDKNNTLMMYFNIKIDNYCDLLRPAEVCEWRTRNQWINLPE